jgi:hypothetical protein
MNRERMYQIIRLPHRSEKTEQLRADSNQYVFEVAGNATIQGGTVHVAGVADGYVRQNREAVLRAAGREVGREGGVPRWVRHGGDRRT